MLFFSLVCCSGILSAIFYSFLPLPPAPWKVMLSQSHLPDKIADFYSCPYRAISTLGHYGAY